MPPSTSPAATAARRRRGWLAAPVSRPPWATVCSSAAGTGSSSTGSSRARRASRSAAHRRVSAACSGCSRSQAPTRACSAGSSSASSQAESCCRSGVCAAVMVRSPVSGWGCRRRVAGRPATHAGRCVRATPGTSRCRSECPAPRRIRRNSVAARSPAAGGSRWSTDKRPSAASRSMRRPISTPGSARCRSCCSAAWAGSTKLMRESRRRWSRKALWAIDSSHTSMSRRWSNWCQCDRPRSSVVCTRSSAPAVSKTSERALRRSRGIAASSCCRKQSGACTERLRVSQTHYSRGAREALHAGRRLGPQMPSSPTSHADASHNCKFAITRAGASGGRRAARDE